MTFLGTPLEPIRPALLTRVAPVTRLVVGLAWLGVAVLTLDPAVPARLALVALAVLALGSGLPARLALLRLSPLLVAGLGLGILTVLYHPAGGDPSVPAIAVIGPVRVTEPGLVAGVAMALRLAVIAVTSLLVFAPSDPTRFADSLVQQWRIPDRFAYGTLAALRIAPLLAADWTAIGAARRLRGIEPRSPAERIRSTGGRLLVLLVASIRRAERMALAMDARGFDTGRPRSRYRPMRLGWLDWAVLAAGMAVAVAALVVDRG